MFKKALPKKEIEAQRHKQGMEKRYMKGGKKFRSYWNSVRVGSGAIRREPGKQG